MPKHRAGSVKLKPRRERPDHSAVRLDLPAAPGFPRGAIYPWLLTFQLALILGNSVAQFVIILPIPAAFVRRMNVEEQALASALGQRYRTYMQHTKRLIPGIIN